MSREIFTVNLYNYLNDPKSYICKKYQDHNRKLIESYTSDTVEYKLVDITDEQEKFLKENTGLYELSPKHKFQMISDFVRYEYLKNNPGSIFIDTDFVIFGDRGLDVLTVDRSVSLKYKKDFTAGEMGRHGQHSCNWLMISGGGDNSLSSQLSKLLVERSSHESIENWKSNNKKFGVYEDSNLSKYAPIPKGDYTELESDDSYERRMVFDLFWGYKLYEFINPNEYRQIPYYQWQCSYWDGDWRDTNVIDKDHILGCHFFGFAKGRPTISEFLEYHKLDDKYNDLSE
jgi:hypothetical protein